MWIYLSAAGVFAVLCAAGLTGFSARNLKNCLPRPRPKEATLAGMAKQKKKRLADTAARIRTMLAATGRPGRFYALLLAALLLFAAGLLLGTASGNYFLAPVLAFGLAAIPFVCLRFQYLNYQKLVLEGLETALSVISVSYERTENILQAVEENTDAINPPIRQVFLEFVSRVKYVDPNIDNAIDEMKTKINHSVFYEWCDALKRCNADRSLKHTLRPIVGKLATIRIVTNDLKTILYRPLRTYRELAAISVGVLWIGLDAVPESLGVALPPVLTQVLIAANVLLLAVTAVVTAIETHDVRFDI